MPFTFSLLDLMQRTKKGFVCSRRSMSEMREAWNWALTVLGGPRLMEEERTRLPGPPTQETGVEEEEGVVMAAAVVVAVVDGVEPSRYLNLGAGLQ